MASQSLQNFIDRYLVNENSDTYQIDHFVIVNNGEMLDGTNKTEQMTGSRLNDIIWGNGGNDLMYGGNGKDLLTGGADDDDMFGGTGDDRLEGWHDADYLVGGAGNDALYGGPGNDDLFGGNGKDYLCAGSNSDELYGGAGADLFVFRPEVDGPKSQSVYKDFEIGIDQLRIDASLMPDGFKMSMIKVAGDGDLFIVTEGGHRMIFETLDRNDIETLYESIQLI